MPALKKSAIVEDPLVPLHWQEVVHADDTGNPRLLGSALHIKYHPLPGWAGGATLCLPCQVICSSR